MPLATSDLKTELRERLGSPSEAKLPETELDRSLKSALREWGRWKPVHGLINFTLQPRITEYPLVGGNTVRDIADYYVMPVGVLYPLYVDPLMPIVSGIPTDLWRELDKRGLLYGRDVFWTIELDKSATPPVLRITPEPMAIFQVYLRVSMAPTWANLDDSDAEILLLYAEAECLNYMALRRNKSVRSVPTATGSLKLDDGNMLFEQAKMKRKEFRDRMGGHATVLAKG